MITRHQSGPRMSQIVTHNGTVYLAGQVAKGATVAIESLSTISLEGIIVSRRCGG